MGENLINSFTCVQVNTIHKMTCIQPMEWNTVAFSKACK